jgi:hypothetical protein
MARLLEPSFTQGPNNIMGHACMLCLIYIYFKTCIDHTVVPLSEHRQPTRGERRMLDTSGARPGREDHQIKYCVCSLLCCYAGKGLEHGRMPLGTANARAGQGAARAMLVPQFCCTHVMQGVPPHACCAPAMNWRLHAAKRSRERAGRPRHSPSPLTSTTAMARGQEHAQCRGTGEVRRVDPCAWERIKGVSPASSSPEKGKASSSRPRRRCHAWAKNSIVTAIISLPNDRARMQCLS